MLKDRDLVLLRLQCLRENAMDYFIPYGGYDDSTPEKLEISNLAGTLHNHIPLLRSIAAACRNLPVYVGYSGQDNPQNPANYCGNLILMNKQAQDDELDAVISYIHESVHLDQDRRGLLYDAKTVPPPDRLKNYYMHHLMLEASAYATQIMCLYHLSKYSKLKDKIEGVDQYFNHYILENDRADLIGIVRMAIGKNKIDTFNDLKPAWAALFQDFFRPDSIQVEHYIKTSSQHYIQQCIEMHDQSMEADRYNLGGVAALRKITTLPGMGPMIPDDALQLMLFQIHGAVSQKAYQGEIETVFDTARRLMHARPKMAP